MATDNLNPAGIDANRPAQIAMLSEMSEQTWAAYTLNDEAATPLKAGPALWQHESAMKRLAAKGDAFSHSILFTQTTHLSDVLARLPLIGCVFGGRAPHSRLRRILTL